MQAVVLLVVAVLVAWHLERRQLHAANDRMILSFDQDRQRWMDERRELLNRIKPETAQPLPQAAPSVPPPPAVELTDDQAVWAATQGMSAEEFAREMDRQERLLAQGAAAEEVAA